MPKFLWHDHSGRPASEMRKAMKARTTSARGPSSEEAKYGADTSAVTGKLFIKNDSTKPAVAATSPKRINSTRITAMTARPNRVSRATGESFSEAQLPVHLCDRPGDGIHLAAGVGGKLPCGRHISGT